MQLLRRSRRPCCSPGHGVAECSSPGARGWDAPRLEL